MTEQRRPNVSPSDFLAFVECAGCGELFAVHSSFAAKRSKWCSARCRKAQYRRPCAVCGQPCGGSDKSTYCTGCAQEISASKSVERWAPRRALIERLWAEGKTGREICEVLGMPYHKVRVANWRLQGYELPYRRSGEALENIRRANAGRFATLRARRGGNRV